MKRINILLLMLVNTILCSCQKEFMDVKINPDVGFSAIGLQTINTITSQQEYVYNLTTDRVIGLSKEVNLKLSVNEAQIKEYNEKNGTDFILMPAEYYQMAAEVNFPANTKTAVLPVKFFPKKLYDAVGLEKAMKYVLPVKIASSDIELKIQDKKMTTLLTLSFDEPKLTVNSPVVPYEFLFLANVPVIREVDVVTQANFDFLETSEVNFTASLANVSAYNTAHSTNFVLLPSANYTIGQVFDKTTRQLKTNIKFDCSKLDDSKKYLLPLSLTNTKGYKVVQDLLVYVIVNVVDFQLSVPAASDLVNKVTNSNVLKHTFNVKVNAAYNEDISLRFNHTPELVTQYNTAHGTNYTALDAGLVTVAPQAIKKGSMSANLDIQVNTSGIELENNKEYLLPVKLDRSTLIAGMNVVTNDVVYVKFKKTLFGLYTATGSLNYMQGQVLPNNQPVVNNVICTYMFTYYTWGNGWEWNITNRAYNGDATKRVVEIVNCRVVSGMPFNQPLPYNRSYLDLNTGDIVLDFAYYYNTSDRDIDKKQVINGKLANQVPLP